MKTIFPLTIFALTCIPSFATGSPPKTFDDFKKDFQEFRNNAKKEFDDFRNKANEDYAEFLRKAWGEYNSSVSPSKPKEEKPPVPPLPYKENDIPIKDELKPIHEVINPAPPTPQPEPISPINPIPSPIPDKWFTFNSFGTPMKVRADESLKYRIPRRDDNSIADAWRTLSSEKYDKIISDCLKLREAHKLSDYGYLMMVNNLTRDLLGDNDEATLLATYILCQSGYKTRIGYSRNKLYLLFGSDYILYDRLYYNIDDDDCYFYPIDCNENNIRISNAAFPEEKPFSMQMSASPVLSLDLSDKRILEADIDKGMSISVNVNKNLIDYYASYPSSETKGNFMTRWAMYANTPVSDQVKNTLYPVLNEKLAGLTTAEALERLLNWVQTAFEYELDDKVWGYDRAFFAEESLYYPYCDCEDRSILFSHLVRDLLKLDVVLIYYPGHLATAVKTGSNEIKGDHIIIDGNRFVICDPTYIGAPVGLTMPGMDNLTAQVILLKR